MEGIWFVVKDKADIVTVFQEGKVAVGWRSDPPLEVQRGKMGFTAGTGEEKVPEPGVHMGLGHLGSHVTGDF